MNSGNSGKSSKVSTKKHYKINKKKVSKNLTIKRTSLQGILSEDLFSSLQNLIAQKLEESDPAVRKEFAKNKLQKINSDNNPLNSLLLTDEAHFYINGDIINRT